MAHKTLFANSSSINKQWHLIDAEGKVLGRLASDIAKIIRGKNKTCFTPHTNCGDKVIIINAEKVRMTGNKLNQKEYIRHTGYPGGQRIKTPRQILEKQPERLIERAVRGMLPNNRLRKEYLSNLHVYAGTEHPHTAQKPKELSI